MPSATTLRELALADEERSGEQMEAAAREKVVFGDASRHETLVAAGVARRERARHHLRGQRS